MEDIRINGRLPSFFILPTPPQKITKSKLVGYFISPNRNKPLQGHILGQIAYKIYA